MARLERTPSGPELVSKVLAPATAQGAGAVHESGRHRDAAGVYGLIVSKPSGEREQVLCVLPDFRMALSAVDP